MRKTISRRYQLSFLIAVLVAAGTVASIMAGSAAGKKATPAVKMVQVVDDYFSMSNMTVKVGQEVKWVWSKKNYDSHNVTLISGPKGVSKKKFTSATGVTGIHFELKFTVPGKYHFRCTVHPYAMNMTITVKR